jgi:hypothetical protein
MKSSEPIRASCKKGLWIHRQFIAACYNPYP